MTLLRKDFRQRHIDREIFLAVKGLGFSDIQAHVAAGRVNGNGKGVSLAEILQPSLKNIQHPLLLTDAEKAASIIISAIEQNQLIGILTDYDVDGICSHMVIIESMKFFSVSETNLLSFIGHRLKDGYGVSERLVDKILALNQLPHLIITADCGSSDEQQIFRLKRAGINVVVTDHHVLPEEGVPFSAHATVNPSRRDCSYPDKTVSGCMVAWLLMCLVRNVLIEKGFLSDKTEKLGHLLDYVCLSTVADAVSLFSPTNRAVVKTGIHIINEKKKSAWHAFAQKISNGNSRTEFTAEDLAFQFAPRINARSRMADPYAALNFFLADMPSKAIRLLEVLEKSNEDRKYTEQRMVKKALEKSLKINTVSKKSLVIFDEDFHAGVQGIVASRLVDTFGKPVVVVSPIDDGKILSGSARTIDSVHIRNVLQRIDDKYPEIFIGFGGHKGAAGIKIKKGNLTLFCNAFEDAVFKEVGDIDLFPLIYTDGILEAKSINFSTFNQLQQLEPYGRGFDEPVFEGIFAVVKSRIVGVDPVHLSLQLYSDGMQFPAIWFRALLKPGEEPPVKDGNTIRCAYRLKLNVFRGNENLQLMIDYAEPVRLSS